MAAQTVANAKTWARRILLVSDAPSNVCRPSSVKSISLLLIGINAVSSNTTRLVYASALCVFRQPIPLAPYNSSTALLSGTSSSNSGASWSRSLSHYTNLPNH